MEIKEYKVLGVMSGTSLDGIDIAWVHFKKEAQWDFKILRARIFAYSDSWKNKLRNALELSPLQLLKFDEEYTTYLAEIVSKFIHNNQIKDLDAVCSHGHTIKHEPENGLTLQIGNLPRLAELVRETVICDFRVQDVALGGQGAPLVPIGDELLFPHFSYCLNLGGFANISTKHAGSRIAYDICAVNTVLNYYSDKLGKEYDEGGRIAKRGKLNPDLNRQLEALSFYKLIAPKSLGIEWVKSTIFPILRGFEDDIPSILNTYCQHIASEIVKNIKDDSEVEVLVTGGGTFNDFLMELLQQKTNAKIVIPSSEIINFKEAVIFGFLGILKLRDEINILSSVTGAKHDHCAGLQFEP